MFCIKCGKLNSETSKFCRNCGNEFKTKHNKEEDREFTNDSNGRYSNHIGVNTPPYPYVITTPKLVTLGLLTFGVYFLYWFYRHFKSLKTERNWEITPWLRAVFWPLTCYSLFKKVSEAGAEYDKKQRINAGLFTAIIIGSIIAGSFFQQLLVLLIFISPLFVILVIILTLLVPTLVLVSVQKRINFYWNKKYGNRLVSSPFTLRDYVVAGLGSLLFIQIGFFLIGMSSFVNVIKNNSSINGIDQPNAVTKVTPSMIPTNTPVPTQGRENNTLIDIGALPAKGSSNAEVTIVEFGSFECPYCRRAYMDALKEVEEKYINTGKVRLAYRHYPLSGIYQHAQRAAEASECANEQNKFWEYHDVLFENQSTWAKLDTLKIVDTFTDYAENLNLDANKFRNCLDSEKYKYNVLKDIADGDNIQVNATPTFFINGQRIDGAVPFSKFKSAIEEELQK